MSLANRAALHMVGYVVIDTRPPDVTSGNHFALLDAGVAGMKQIQDSRLQHFWDHHACSPEQTTLMQAKL